MPTAVINATETPATNGEVASFCSGSDIISGSIEGVGVGVGVGEGEGVNDGSGEGESEGE